MNIDNIVNPKITGAGLWYIIHLKAIISITPEQKDEFVRFMHTIASNFNCPECKEDLYKFMLETPIQVYWFRTNGFFEWSWLLHNSVNKRLGKYEPSYEEAYTIYSKIDQLVCTTCENKFFR